MKDCPPLTIKVRYLNGELKQTKSYEASARRKLGVARPMMAKEHPAQSAGETPPLLCRITSVND